MCALILLIASLIAIEDHNNRIAIAKTTSGNYVLLCVYRNNRTHYITYWHCWDRCEQWDYSIKYFGKNCREVTYWHTRTDYSEGR